MAAGVGQVARQYESRVPIVGVPGRDDREAMQAFVDRYDLGFVQAVSDDGALWARFGVRGQPAWLFITADGDVKRTFRDYAPGELARELDALLG